MLIDRITVDPDLTADETLWPMTVPAIRDVGQLGLELTSDLVVLVGANGSGKSTLLEAIAEAYGIDVRGGHGGRRYAGSQERSLLGEALRLHRTGPARGSPAAGPPASSCAPRPPTACSPP